MLGFGSSDKEEAPNVEAQIVDDLDAEFSSWTQAQKNAFAQLLCRLLPAIAAEGDGAAQSLPLDRVGAILKQSVIRLVASLAWDRKGCLDRLGAAFLSRGPSIRAFCAATAKTIPELNPIAGDLCHFCHHPRHDGPCSPACPECRLG
jgi:hypothetical protein